MQPFKWADGLKEAARDEVEYMINNGKRSKIPLLKRLKVHGEYKIKCVEAVNVVKSYSSAEDIVALLLIDDGDKKRENRSILFDGSYKVAGCFA